MIRASTGSGKRRVISKIDSLAFYYSVIKRRPIPQASAPVSRTSGSLRSRSRSARNLDLSHESVRVVLIGHGTPGKNDVTFPHIFDR